MRSFDFFEFVGIIVPGALFIWGLTLVFQPMYSFFFKDADLLKLGYFLIFAYATGHLIQAPGNFVEWLWWKIRGGQPSDWMRKADQRAFSSKWREFLIQDMGIENTQEDIPLKEWRGYFSELRATVAKDEKRYSRTYFFLGNLNMFRGLAAAALFIAGVEIYKWILWLCYRGQSRMWFTLDALFALIALIITALCMYRFDRFGKHYAKELFAQYLSLKKVK